MTHEEYMAQAIAKTKEGIAAGQSPFGAIIVKGDQILSASHNTVWRDHDPTAHAEVNAIRAAGQHTGEIDFTGSVMYTTCEPCPMCLSAIHWAKIDRVYFGATIEDAQEAGFSELLVKATDLAKMGQSSLLVETGPLRQECRELFGLWKQTGLCGTY